MAIDGDAWLTVRPLNVFAISMISSYAIIEIIQPEKREKKPNRSESAHEGRFYSSAFPFDSETRNSSVILAARLDAR